MPNTAPQPRPLSAKQQAFVFAYIGAAKHNATEAARLAGYSHPNKQGPALLVNLGIKAAITQHLQEIKSQGIAVQQNRIDAYNDRWLRMQQVITERASDPTAQDMPGGKSGLIVKQLKKVHHRYEPNPDDEKGEPVAVTEERWEAATDTGLLREFRELEKQASQEMGDWTEKSEVLATGAVRMEIAGMRVPLPTTEDASE